MQISDNVFLNVVTGTQTDQHTPKEGDTHVDLYWDESDLCWKFRVIKYDSDNKRISTPTFILQRGNAVGYNNSNKFYELTNGLPSQRS